MRDEYDFSEATPNPYVKPQKSSVTIPHPNKTVKAPLSAHGTNRMMKAEPNAQVGNPARVLTKHFTMKLISRFRR